MSSTLTGLGLGLGGLVAGSAFGAPAGAGPGRAKHCIVLYMSGGASHIDTFDPKSHKDTGGNFRAIGTSVAGVQISEHLPMLARRAGELAIVRSLTAKEGNHKRARYLMHTGFVRQGAVDHPGLGSQVARLHSKGDLPPLISLGAPGQAPGYLGAEHAAYSVVDPSREVRNLRAPAGLDADRRLAREGMWRVLEDRFARTHAGPELAGHRAISERAITMSRAACVQAFDLSRESAATRARYGDTKFGSGCLMARRLLEVDVPFVQVSMKGWDTHDNIFDQVAKLSRGLDAAMSGLIDDLKANGKWSETLLVWMGDFGRSPKINDRGGRDHWPHASSVVFGGGVVQGGQVIGATDKRGAQVTQRPVAVAALFATMAQALGVPRGEMHMTPRGRPVRTVDEAGKIIDGLLL